MTEQRRGILAGGNWILDTVKTVDHYPTEGALANVLSEQVCNGGSPYNVLIDLVRLGAPFPLEAVGLVGDDAAGARIRQDCTLRGIDVAQLHTAPFARTSSTDVFSVEGTGRRTFFHHRGANSRLGPKHFDFANSGARHFHLGYLMLLDALDHPHPRYGTVAADLLRIAHEHGLSTSIDLVSAENAKEYYPEIVLPALRFCDLCFLNEFEAEHTTGVALRVGGALQWTSLESAGRVLLEAGVRLAFIHFPEGACAIDCEGFVIQPRVTVPESEIAGEVGAGDAFAAGALLGYHERETVEECLRIGVACAASCIRHSTTSEGVGTLAECLGLADRLGFEKSPI